jgi:tetratricopeptide (TPR) repeat protein
MRTLIHPMGTAFVVFVLLLGSASAQQGGTSGGKVTQPKVPARTTPNTVPTTPRPTIFYMGKVAMDTGMAPPTPVAVLRICNGSARRETMTSSDGSFSFMLDNRPNDMLPDASDDTQGFGPDSLSSRSNPLTTGQRSQDLTINDCELRAGLAGYSSSAIRLDPSMNNSNVGVIVLHYRGKKAEGMVSVAALEVPAKARKEYEKGSESLEKGNLPEAEKSLRKAIDLYPKFAEAWLRLGDLELRRKNADGASADYQEAINADPNFTLPYIRLASLLAQAQNWEQTRQVTDRVISLDPVNYPLAYYLNAIANMNLKRMAQAETSALRAETLDKQHIEPRVELLLATIYVAKGSYSSAAEHYRAYLKLVPDGPLNERVKTDLAKIEEMAKSQTTVAPPVNK